jgi:hypothetical protein
MFALWVRQPYAEEILRGIRTIEYRNWPVSKSLIGKRIHLFAEMEDAEGEDINERFRCLGCRREDLPRGVLVGTATLSLCKGAAGTYELHLTQVQRHIPPLQSPVEP